MKIKYDHLLGIPFEQGKSDCYSHLQKMYFDNLGLKLTDYARPNDWWLYESMDLYKDNFKKEGFQIVDGEVQVMDVFLISIPDPRMPKRSVVNHAAIYIGEGYITHHLLGRMSEKLLYRGAMRNLTVMTLRHESMLNFKFVPIVEKPLDLMDYLLPHKRALLQKAMPDGTKS